MIHAFDDYQLNTDVHELSRAGVPIAVEPQTFAVLRTLIENHDTVLTRDDLVDAVWRGRFTSDSAIASRIKSARKAIGDDGKTQRYIKTVHGIGYRFVGALRNPSSAALPRQPEAPVREALPEQVDSRPVVLVTPFGDPGQPGSITASGLTHDVIIGLSRLRWLKVIAWASAMRLQSGDSDKLRPLTAADYCLAGELEHQGNGLALAVRLTDLRDDAVVWADRFNAASGDINALRNDVVQQAVNALELQISAAEAAKAQYLHTSNLDAWSNYHLGLLHMYRFNARDNAFATAHFERAVTLQPDFARAHAGLSFAHFQSAFNRYPDTDSELCRRAAVESAQRSVELDALDPLANFVMGRSFWLSDDVASGQPWLERALTISGNFAQAHYSHGLATVMLDTPGARNSDGHREASAAIALSPLDPFMYGFFGVRALSFLRDGKLEDARFWANRAARQPNAIAAMDFIAAAACGIAGEKAQAEAWARRARERSGNADSRYFFRALPFSEGKLRAEMEKAFDEVGLSPHG